MDHFFTSLQGSRLLNVVKVFFLRIPIKEQDWNLLPGISSLVLVMRYQRRDLQFMLELALPHGMGKKLVIIRRRVMYERFFDGVTQVSAELNLSPVSDGGVYFTVDLHCCYRTQKRSFLFECISWKLGNEDVDQLRNAVLMTTEKTKNVISLNGWRVKKERGGIWRTISTDKFVYPEHSRFLGKEAVKASIHFQFDSVGSRCRAFLVLKKEDEESVLMATEPCPPLRLDHLEQYICDHQVILKEMEDLDSNRLDFVVKMARSGLYTSTVIFKFTLFHNGEKSFENIV